ncbi:unnamed protein product [Larinioides sclopetarius]|uniref:Uncharacterized protein n=1 Tax=Larinioides sclopetarius TaxID=280406 RepID=A0AAV2B769_9ARAC
MRCTLKLLSYGLSYHGFLPRFVLFLIVGTGISDVRRGYLLSSVESHLG